MNKFLILLFLGAHMMWAQSYTVKNGQMILKAKAKTVGIESEFEGKGDGLSGRVDLTAKTISFTYDLWKIDTGIELRNDHMHENYLETEDYPEATYVGRILSYENGEIRTSGTFTLHGESKEIEINGNITGDQLTATWILPLTDYDIDIPQKFLIAKLNEKLQMTITCTLIKE